MEWWVVQSAGTGSAAGASWARRTAGAARRERSKRATGFFMATLTTVLVLDVTPGVGNMGAGE
jgi:hypothetical protein